MLRVCLRVCVRAALVRAFRPERRAVCARTCARLEADAHAPAWNPVGLRPTSAPSILRGFRVPEEAALKSAFDIDDDDVWVDPLATGIPHGSIIPP